MADEENAENAGPRYSGSARDAPHARRVAGPRDYGALRAMVTSKRAPPSSLASARTVPP
jgi:hypothetical protein